MKRIVVMAVLALAMPLAAFAGTIKVFDDGGTLKGVDDALRLTGSELSEVHGGGLGLIQGALGRVTFTTGAMESGSYASGATFASGGTFKITSNGTDGLPDGTLFKGSFSSTVSWAIIGGGQCSASGSVCYSLTGEVSGTWYGGSKPVQVSGATVQLVFNTGTDGFMGSAPLQGGVTSFTSPVPEPGTLGLLGTGLLGLGGVLRRKFKA
jgi:hypothetical protein